MADISRLPGPIFDVWEWQFKGACRDAEPDLFFHPEGERGAAKRSRDAAAKAVCATCPVIAQCRAHALSVQEPYGVWGGMTEEERQLIIERRKLVAAGTTGGSPTFAEPVPVEAAASTAAPARIVRPSIPVGGAPVRIGTQRRRSSVNRQPAAAAHTAAVPVAPTA